jgi:hypothetical protein
MLFSVPSKDIASKKRKLLQQISAGIRQSGRTITLKLWKRRWRWLLENRDRTDLKNPVEDFAIRVTCDHDDVEVRINLLGGFLQTLRERNPQALGRLLHGKQIRRV